MAEPERRRRRLRPPSSAGAPAAVPTAGAPPADPPAEQAVTAPETARPRPTAGARRPPAPASGGGEEREAERGLRGLVGSGSSQVSVGAAMRARDAARPTDEHEAEADRNLTIVRRNWTPREELPRR